MSTSIVSHSHLSHNIALAFSYSTITKMAPVYNSISEITHMHENWSLQVRVTRKWIETNPSNNNAAFSLEMVLMDSMVGYVILAVVGYSI